MALNDFVFRVKPAAGHAGLRDEVTNTVLTATSSGSCVTTLVDTGGGVMAWRFKRGMISFAMPPISALNLNTGSGDPGITVTVRMRVVADQYGVANMRMFQLGATTGAYDGISITRPSSAGVDLQHQAATASHAIDPKVLRNYVIVVRPNAGGAGEDPVETWFTTAGRSGSAPNTPSPPLALALRTGGGFTTLSFNQSETGASGEAAVTDQYENEIHEIIVHRSAKTQAEAASLADVGANLQGLVADGDTVAPLIAGPSGTAGNSTSGKVQAEGGTTVHTFTANESVTWDLNGGADVARFSINSSTGALAFLIAPDFEAPTDVGTNNTYVVGVRATDTAGNASTQTVTVTITGINEAPTFSGTISIPTLTEGVAMSSYATAGFFADQDAGDTAAYSAIGAWPSGVTVNSSTGVISGTPATAGTYASLQVRRTDSEALTANSNTFTITVAAAGGVTFIGTVPAQSGTVGAAFTTLAAGNYFSGVGAYSVQSGSLPGGLSLNTSTGAISGTPTAAGTFSSVVIRKTAFSGSPATADTNAFAFTIAAAPVSFGFDLHTLAGCKMTSFAGSGAALNSEVGTQVVVVAMDPTTDAEVARSGTLTADSASRLPRWAHAALSGPGTSYDLKFKPLDGRAPYMKRVTTT